jgi:hypothetical protein
MSSFEYDYDRDNDNDGAVLDTSDSVQCAGQASAEAFWAGIVYNHGESMIFLGFGLTYKTNIV